MPYVVYDVVYPLISSIVYHVRLVSVLPFVFLFLVRASDSCCPASIVCMVSVLFYAIRISMCVYSPSQLMHTCANHFSRQDLWLLTLAVFGTHLRSDSQLHRVRQCTCTTGNASIHTEIVAKAWTGRVDTFNQSQSCLEVT